MNLTVKVRIHPTGEQKVFYGMHRINVDTSIILVPTDRKEPVKTQKSVKYIEQQRKLPRSKKNNLELKRVYSTVLQ
jgi:hypothetical protein